MYYQMLFKIKWLLFVFASIMAGTYGEQMTIFEMAFQGLEENMVGKGNSIMVKDDPPEVFLKTIDTNGDKKISMDEAKKLAKDGLDVIFKLIDGNMDGFLTGSEIQSGDLNFAGLAKCLNVMFTIFDSNKDGFINTEDGTRFLDAENKELAKKLDKNDDGRITLKEFREMVPEKEAPIPKEAMTVYKLLDRNEDSQFSKEEIEKFLRATFNMIDKNNNGLINGEEAITALEKHGMKEKFISVIKMKYKEAMMVLQNKNITDYVISKLDENQDNKVSAEEFMAVLDKPPPNLEEDGKLLEENIKMSQEKSMAKSMDTTGKMNGAIPSPDEMMTIFKSALNDLEESVVSLEKNSAGLLSSSWILVSVFIIYVVTIILHF